MKFLLINQFQMARFDQYSIRIEYWIWRKVLITSIRDQSKFITARINIWRRSL